MATRTGAIGKNDSSGYRTKFKTPKSIGIQLAAGEYPNGAITFTNIKNTDVAKWFNENYAATLKVKLYLCDSAGNNKVKLGEWTMEGQSAAYNRSFTVSGATGLAGKALYLIMDDTASSGSGWDSRDYTVLRYRTGVSVSTAYNQFSVTCASNGHGTLTAGTATAVVGSTVTLVPTPAEGYELDSYTTVPAGLTITGNQFTMPAQAVTVTATFRKKDYAITKGTIPSGAGTVTAPATAQVGDTVSVSQAPGTGYWFNGWTSSPAVAIENGAFTMPASAVSLTANYLKRSTAQLSSDSVTGGGGVNMAITAEDAAYTHKYKLSFGTNMETSWVDVAAGVTQVAISIPEGWSNYIPNAESKSGGTLELQTYNGATLIGTYTVSGLTYNVPASAVPEIGDITTSVARTIGGTTYANIGNIYTQLHCGVEVEAEAEGALSSTIASMRVQIGGYSGGSYDSTVNDDEIDFTSGLLSIAGETLITVTATDSRGRTATKTATITVTAYNAPSGALAVRRVDVNGDDDDTGQYAKYILAKSYTAIGSNALTVSMTSQSITEVISSDTGDILPGAGSRQTFSTQQEFTITVTLADAFETVTVVAKLRSAKFILYVDAGGDKLGLMKAANKTIPAGKNATIEFSADAQIYIGDDTLETYIQNIVSNL